MKQKFTAWSDGSCDNLNPAKPGGAAYVIFDDKGNLFRKSSKGFICTTSNRMELLAIISIVNALPPDSHVTIHTDSEYCIKALLSGHPQANLDQIAHYHRLCSERNISVLFKWVKGHAGDEHNEECDFMARTEYQKMCDGYTSPSTSSRHKNLAKKKRNKNKSKG